MRLRRLLGACVGAGALLLSPAAIAGADTMSSINIVEPKVQSKWGFAPATQRVAPGTWITWSNAGQDPHTVVADDGSFDSGNLDPSEGFSWFFSDPGTFTYTCTLHSWMKGKIIVGDGTSVQPSAVSDQPGPSDQVPPDDQTPPPN
jgi:plastocyanin